MSVIYHRNNIASFAGNHVSYGYGKAVIGSFIAAAVVVATGDVTFVLQKDSGSGFADIPGTIRNVSGASGDWTNVSIDSIIDVAAGDKLQIAWVENGSDIYTIPANNSMLTVEYLKVQQ